MMGIASIWGMVEKMLPKEFQALVKGLDIDKLIGLMGRKVPPTKIEVADAVKPILLKMEPGMMFSLAFLKEKYTSDVFLTIYEGQTDSGQPVPVVSVCTMAENGALELRETFSFAQMGHYVANLLSEGQAQKQIELPKLLPE